MLFFLIYFILHFLLYLIFRVQFLVWNWKALKNLTTSDFLLAFLNGIRFDLAAISIPVAIVMLCWLWFSGHSKTLYKKALLSVFIIFTILHTSLIFLNFSDSELFNFTARRFSKSAFFLFNEARFSNLVAPYIGMFFITLAVITIYIFCVRYLYVVTNIKNFPDISRYSRIKKISLSIGIVFCAVIMARGGLQVKPLTFVDAKLFNESYANNLVLNSTFTLFKSFGKPAIERIHFFDEKKMLSLLNPQNIPTQYQSNINTTKLNVIYIFLESFSKEYLLLKNPEVTPYLNSLIQKSVYFEQSFANGRRSIEGVAALLSGIPALMEEPFINSEFSANQIIGLGTLLEAQRYHTSFFHGAENGSMHFDQFIKSVGIQNYFGKNEFLSEYKSIPSFKDLNLSDVNDGVWGIYDEPFLQWSCEKINHFPRPFFTSVFTISSHQPYSVPLKYQSQFIDFKMEDQKLSHPILKSIQYADYALKRFMECAEKQEWYKNTVFILTADHTGPVLNENSDFKSRFEVPIIFFSPQSSVIKNLSNQQLAQHIDLVPTVLEMLEVPYKNKNYLARSLWQKGPKLIALYADGKYELVTDEMENKLENKVLQEEKLKAIRQYFSEGLFDNRLYYPSN